MHIRNLALSFLGVLLLGTVGYHFIEGWGFFDAFYMTAITVTTVGFGELFPLSTLGRAFTLLILFTGFGVAFLALSQVASSVLRGELQQLLGKRRMQKDLERMTNHYILCGYGRMGRVIAREFAKRKLPFIVIEKKPEEARTVGHPHEFPFIVGDASDEDILLGAGVEKAKGVITVVSTDADNAFITMTARGLNSKLRIVARAADQSSLNKLRLAGADKVISPYIIGGTRIAQAILNPALVDFIELATDRGSVDIEMAEIGIPSGSAYEGKFLDDPHIKRLELIFVSIQRSDHTTLFKPDAKTKLVAGDRIVAVGRPEQIQLMIAEA